MNLSDEQKLIVETKEPYVVVCAAAASGKTFTIVERLRYLLRNGIDPSKIVAITFTNNAADEMKERLGADYKKGMFIGTVHSYANQILRKNWVETSSYLEKENFDELFKLVKKNLTSVPEIEYLIVDEAQDSDQLQYDFFLNVLKPKNWMLVGDWRQSIYSFKAACPEKLIELTKQPLVKTYDLNLNYRNGRKIHKFAANILKPLGIAYTDDSVIMRDVVDDVEKIEISLKELVEGLKLIKNFGSYFILCRSNKEVEDICYLLKKNNIPYDSFKQADLNTYQLKKKMEENTIKVLTIHSSKGLEADNVIVIGARFWNDEERRVAYVAATRARNKLIWIKKPKKKTKKAVSFSWD